MHRLIVPCILLLVIVAEGAWLFLLERGVMWLLALLLLVAASLSNEDPPMGIAGVFGIVLGAGLVALFGVLYALCRDVDSRDSTT